MAALAEQVLGMVGPAMDARATMWTYVASLASYAADLMSRPPDEDKDLIAFAP